ncbi:hypothetical protein [Falsiroseomonas tokyonensis]|uniref:Transposase n=1 Tax=Falsiroseomonas tokyonensis TaxID=430521 RepID=A0ABV7C1Q2_9PROT|nr:hypothetical protein [Falsiroseomonas tokyonensis]MBU8540236.1 hypothetical protein [Falsiroseomonas tokyonensis]
MKNAGAPVRAGEKVPLAQQIACVERELRLRRSAYPRWVAAGRMTEEKAAAETWQMQAVLDTLRGLAGTPTAVQPDLLR